MPLTNRTEAFLAFLDAKLLAAQNARLDEDEETLVRMLILARRAIQEWRAGEAAQRLQAGE
jgi:hypothetical protein